VPQATTATSIPYLITNRTVSNTVPALAVIAHRSLQQRQVSNGTEFEQWSCVITTVRWIRTPMAQYERIVATTLLLEAHKSSGDDPRSCRRVLHAPRHHVTVPRHSTHNHRRVGERLAVRHTHAPSPHAMVRRQRAAQ
jgi:hypothetical protein